MSHSVENKINSSIEIMHSIITSLLSIVTLIVGGFLIYSFYCIEKLRINLENQIHDIHAKVLKLVNAINAVNYSEFRLDAEQQQKIEELSKRS